MVEREEGTKERREGGRKVKVLIVQVELMRIAGAWRAHVSTSFDPSNKPDGYGDNMQVLTGVFSTERSLSPVLRRLDCQCQRGQVRKTPSQRLVGGEGEGGRGALRSGPGTKTANVSNGTRCLRGTSGTFPCLKAPKI